MLNEQEILANELNKQNDWKVISNQKLSNDDMHTWIEYLDWYYVAKNNVIAEDILIKVSNKLDNITWRKISQNQNLSEEFIIKYKDKLDIDEVLKRGYLPIKFIAKHLVPMPEIGMGATVATGSDCSPYSVIEVNKAGTKIKIQSDNYKPAADYDYYSNQKYKYTPNPNGNIYELSLRKNGRWKIVKDKYSNIHIGHRKAYQDPSF